MKSLLPIIALTLLGTGSHAAAADYPRPAEGQVIVKDFKLASGEILPELRMHYQTIGQPERDKDSTVRNAVLILHGTGGQGSNFVGRGRADEWFAGELFGKGRPLDAGRYFIIIPDNLGHGRSSKPSDGLKGRFPSYGYYDMIEAQHRLLVKGLRVNHLRLVLGTSMGTMHTWLWGQRYPDFMDALLPLASLPTQISGRNRMWRKTIIEAIRTDPEYQGGEYKTQPRSLRLAAQMLFLMSSNPVQRQTAAPTLKQADELFDKSITETLARMDANDTLYALASSFDYDPGPGLEKITAPLLAINFADDLINPPELGILEKEIQHVQGGKAIVIPMGAETVGHGTHTKAAVWKQHLERFLKETER